jgi:hypothetical protein
MPGKDENVSTPAAPRPWSSTICTIRPPRCSVCCEAPRRRWRSPSAQLFDSTGPSCDASRATGCLLEQERTRSICVGVSAAGAVPVRQRRHRLARWAWRGWLKPGASRAADGVGMTGAGDVAGAGPPGRRGIHRQLNITRARTHSRTPGSWVLWRSGVCTRTRPSLPPAAALALTSSAIVTWNTHHMNAPPSTSRLGVRVQSRPGGAAGTRLCGSRGPDGSTGLTYP